MARQDGFEADALKRLRHERSVPLLGQIPIEEQVRVGGDGGRDWSDSLHGIPLAVKDIICTKTMPTSRHLLTRSRSRATCGCSAITGSCAATRPRLRTWRGYSMVPCRI